MANSFPSVNFDWLGELPGIADETRVRNVERQTLSDLRSTDPDSLENAATRILRAGGSTKTALALQQAALARRTLEQKGESDRAYSEFLRNYRGAPGAAGAVDPTPDAPEIPFGGGATGATPSSGPSPFGPNPLAPQQRQSAVPSPSDQMISAAQAGAPVAPERVALAGQVPTPDSAPTQPAWLDGAQAKPMTVAPKAPSQTNYGPITTENADARAEYTRAGQALLELPPKGTNTPAGQALLRQFNSAGARLKLDPKERDYQLSRIQRKQDGLPDWSRTDFELYKTTAPDRLKEANKRYETYAANYDSGTELATKLGRMSEVLNHPQFVSGDFNSLDSVKKFATNFIDTLGAHGVQIPKELRARLDQINEPTALKEAFQSLAAQGVIQALGGSLGRGISSSDQQYMAKAFPDLMKTKSGIKIIQSIMGEAADRQKLAGQTARDYMNDRQMRATAPELDTKVAEALDQYGQKKSIFTNNDGSPTELALRVESERAAAGGGAQAPATGAGPAPAAAPVAQPTPQASPAPREGALVQDAQGKKYRIQNGQPVPIGGMGL